MWQALKDLSPAEADSALMTWVSQFYNRNSYMAVDQAATDTLRRYNVIDLVFEAPCGCVPLCPAVVKSFFNALHVRLPICIYPKRALV